MEWVCSEVRPGAALAYARGVPGFVILGLARNRFCENIGRHHKGNRILIVVQLHPPPSASYVNGNIVGLFCLYSRSLLSV